MSGYGTRPVKRRRRSKAEIAALRTEIFDACAKDHPISVRGVFYRLANVAVEKTKNDYRAVQRQLLAMRRDGEIPTGWIADATRWMRKPASYTGLEDMLRASAALYRRDLWHESDIYVEVWIESDALAGVIHPVTEKWDVPLMVSRGFSSETFLEGAAEAIRARADRDIRLYYLGDHDPSGKDIERDIVARLGRLAPEADFELERLAVSPAQIKTWNLPSALPKRSDSRTKNWNDGGTVESEAIAPNVLRQLVDNAISSNVDIGELTRLEEIEQAERDQLDEFVGYLGGAR